MEDKDVARRLDSLENNIRATFDRGNRFELSECEESINGSLMSLNRALREDTPEEIKSLLRRIKNNVENLIEDTRDEQKSSTIQNLQRTSIRLEEAIEGLQEFEVSGVELTGQQDMQYERDVAKIVDRETEAFIQDYRIRDPRVVDALHKEMSRLGQSLSNVHDRVTTSMKNTIHSKVEEIGRDLVTQKEEKDKKDRGNDFASSLQSQTKTTEEVTRSDAKELSDNERAFIDTSEQPTTTKKDLASLFK